jgi:hypothetical protein
MSPRRTISELCLFQAGWCGRLGSPLYEHLLNCCATDYEQGGRVRELLDGHEEDSQGSALALRLMGGVHRMVLEGHAPKLAQFYPSAGGKVALNGAWEAFRATLQEQMQTLRQLILRPVQTNEVGRCGALLGGFLLVARHTGLPLRLLEIGASAGLNLRWDHYRYTWDGGAWGDSSSPVVLHDVLDGEAQPPICAARVVERSGCDPHPIDPTSEEGRLTLLSFIWPDQPERIRLLEAALRVTRLVPGQVDRAGAVEWLTTRLAQPIPGQATVLFHSVVWPYLSREDRQRVTEIIDAAGSRATPAAPFAWLRLEPGQETAELKLRIFPGFDDQLIATAGYHKPGVRWLADTCCG